MLINTQISDYADVNSERAVIESFFLDPDLIYQTDISVLDFTHSSLRAIYEAMLKLNADGIAINDISAILQAHPDIEQGFLFDIFSHAVTSANIKYHAKILKQKTFNRKARETLAELQTHLGDDDFLQSMELAVTRLNESRSSKDITIPECLALIQKNIEEAKKRDYYGIQTGFSRLNGCILGLCPQHLIMLGGYTSQGKSTILSQITKDICRNSARVVVFTVEDSVRDKLLNLIACITQEQTPSIVRGWASQERLNRAYEEIKGWNLNIYDSVYTLEEIELKIKKHKLQKGVDVVCIDYVQNLQVKGDGIYDRMSYVSVKLQEMKQKHNVNIIALSQMSEGDKLRGAQELESEADIVLAIDRDKEANIKGDRNLNLIVKKNRPFKKVGKIPMQFTATWTGVEEVEVSNESNA